jgi:hypothetical protein
MLSRTAIALVLVLGGSIALEFSSQGFEAALTIALRIVRRVPRRAIAASALDPYRFGNRLMVQHHQLVILQCF